MKIRVTMKDPDTLDDAVREAASESVAGIAIDASEREALAEVRYDRLRESCGKWFKYGEYLTVEIDTDADTCVVIRED